MFTKKTTKDGPPGAGDAGREERLSTDAWSKADSERGGTWDSFFGTVHFTRKVTPYRSPSIEGVRRDDIVPLQLEASYQSAAGDVASCEAAIKAIESHVRAVQASSRYTEKAKSACAESAQRYIAPLRREAVTLREIAAEKGAAARTAFEKLRGIRLSEREAADAAISDIDRRMAGLGSGASGEKK